MDQQGYLRSRRQARLIAAGALGAVLLSLGMSFAAVPLYRKFCQATGFAGTTQVAEGPAALTGRRFLNVRFDANVAPGLPWRFEPETPSINIRTGATATVFFKVTNESDRKTVADARYNVTPEVSGLYFKKIACFCFSEQSLQPHESLEMPVVFYLDPALEKDETMAAVDTLTLSYTFFAAKGRQPLAEAEGTKAKL
jgi:cytochrome c oxidase assembly protein subunit 11